MKSLATTLLIFLTCLAVSGTIALVDRAQAVLYLASDGNTPADMKNVTGAVTFAEFATNVQEKFALPQPADLVVFDDLRRAKRTMLQHRPSIHSCTANFFVRNVRSARASLRGIL
jgi:hypothetical protein